MNRKQFYDRRIKEIDDTTRGIDAFILGSVIVLLCLTMILFFVGTAQQNSRKAKNPKSVEQCDSLPQNHIAP